MPVYVRKCSKCGETKEQFESLAAEDLIECPNCKEKSFAKLPTYASFAIK